MNYQENQIEKMNRKSVSFKNGSFPLKLSETDQFVPQTYFCFLQLKENY